MFGSAGRARGTRPTGRPGRGQVTALFSGYVAALLDEAAANPAGAWQAKDCAIYLVTALVRSRTCPPVCRLSKAAPTETRAAFPQPATGPCSHRCQGACRPLDRQCPEPLLRAHALLRRGCDERAAVLERRGCALEAAATGLSTWCSMCMHSPRRARSHDFAERARCSKRGTARGAQTVRGRTAAAGATDTNQLVALPDFYARHIAPELAAADVNERAVIKADALKFITTFRGQARRDPH